MRGDCVPDDASDSEKLIAELAVAKREMVNHPNHYGGKDNVYEAIKVMESWLTPDEFVGAMKFNIFTYLARERRKDGDQDISKAAWYANYLADYKKRRKMA